MDGRKCCVPGRTDLAGHGGQQKLLSGEHVPGSGVVENVHCGAESWGALAYQDVSLLETWDPQRDAG
jgi:hypothetical protein